jgi:catechol 2,3-dioxygenase-like lactoylglutathione lyase family enzyme
MTHDIGHAAPILRVADAKASLAYYTSSLGFSVNWEEAGMASVSRDRCTLFLCEYEQSQPRMWVWLGCRDVDALHEELQTRYARVRHPPTNFPWAKEMQVEDLDGNVLRLGSDPSTDEPYGAFLDAAGVEWPMGDSR